MNAPELRAPKVDPEAPWLGLRPFTEDVKDYFFGRTAELAELFERVVGRPLTILFGQSGLGKTSLLQAALVPRLRGAGFAPVLLRLDHSVEAPSLERQVQAALRTVAPPGGAADESPSLWLHLHDPKYGLCAANSPRLILLLDQFEEIFTLGNAPERQALSRAFLRVLADLVENRVPQNLRAQLAHDEALADRLEYTARPCKVLLSLREDYLNQLERSRKPMPSLMDNRMELRRLNGVHALEATVEPGKLRCRSHPELPPLVSEVTGKAIVRFVADVADAVPLEEIDAVPPLLSLLCAELNAARGKAQEITAERLTGRAEDILSSFYERCFHGLRPRVRAFVEDHLLSPEGFRQSANYDTYLHEMERAGIDQAEAARILVRLVDDRLLVSEERDRIRRIELTHDILTRVVRRSREKRVEMERREKVRQKRLRWTLLLAGLFGVISAVSLPLMIWALGQRDAAQTNSARVEQLLEQAARDVLGRGRPRDALAYLARSLDYRPGGIVAAQQAFFLLQDQPAGTLAILEGHSQAVGSAVFSADGKRVLTASRDLSARVWDADSGKVLAQLKGHFGDVTSAVFSADGKRALTASADYSARIWDADSGNVLMTLEGHSRIVNSAVYSPDGKRVLTASSDGTARIWDADSGKMLADLWGHRGPVNSAVFSPDGRRVLTASADRSARVWDAASGKVLAQLKGHFNDVTSAVFSPDGRRVLTASEDHTACIWDGNSGKMLACYSGKVDSAVFSLDGKRVLTASADNTARIWDANSGKILADLRGHSGAVKSAVFSLDGKRVLTASADNTARIWDADSGEILAEFRGHSGAVRSAVFSPDGKRVLTASADTTARIWKADSPKLAADLKGHSDQVMSAVYSPDGKRVLTASADNTARIWDANSGNVLMTLEGHSYQVNSAVYSADGKRVLTASADQTARIWDADSRNVLMKFRGHSDQVMSAVYSPDGTRVLTASLDHTARIWDADSGNVVKTFSGHSGQVWSAVYSPDGTRVLTASADNTACIWDANSAKLLTQLKGHSSYVVTAVYSPDGKRVLTASADNTARIWDADSGNVLARLEGHSDTVESAAYSPDGKRVLTASADMTARIWDASSARLLAELRGHSGNVNTAVFSSDGKRALTASADMTARIWELLDTSEPAPAWFPELLRVAGHRTLSFDDELVNIAGPKWRKLRASVIEKARKDTTRYGEIGRWYFGLRQ